MVALRTEADTSEITATPVVSDNGPWFRGDLAHVLTNDDRDAAEQAESFLLGEGWAVGRW
jgi:hypothetical protein